MAPLCANKSHRTEKYCIVTTMLEIKDCIFPTHRHADRHTIITQAQNFRLCETH